MGNNQTKTINSIAERIYFDVVRVEDEFNTFIENDTGEIDKNKITGGVSSGTMSSETYNADDISIDIWYDISKIKYDEKGIYTIFFIDKNKKD